MFVSLIWFSASGLCHCVIDIKHFDQHEWKGSEALQLVLPQWRAWWILQVTERNVHIVRVYLTVNHLGFCYTIVNAALTTWRPAMEELWRAQCCASLSATSVEPLVMLLTPSGWLLFFLCPVLVCCLGIVPWTKMVPLAMGQVCLSSRPGEMLLEISPPAGWSLRKKLNFK